MRQADRGTVRSRESTPPHRTRPTHRIRSTARLRFHVVFEAGPTRTRVRDSWPSWSQVPTHTAFGGIGFSLNPGRNDGLSVRSDDRVPRARARSPAPIAVCRRDPMRRASPSAARRSPARTTPTAKLVTDAFEARFVGHVGRLGQPAFRAGWLAALVEQAHVDLGIPVARVVPRDGETGLVAGERRLIRARATLADLNGSEAWPHAASTENSKCRMQEHAIVRHSLRAPSPRPSPCQQQAEHGQRCESTSVLARRRVLSRVIARLRGSIALLHQIAFELPRIAAGRGHSSQARGHLRVVLTAERLFALGCRIDLLHRSPSPSPA